MEGHFEIDERRWREKVRKLMFENEDLRKKYATPDGEYGAYNRAGLEQMLTALKEKNSTLELHNTSLAEENAVLSVKADTLKNEIAGLKMKLGRYQKKETKD